MSRLGFARRVLALGTFVATGAFFVTSCLTPEFDFGSDTISPGSGGLGGAGSNPAAHCTNRTQDADETDVDCGGNDCSPCSDGAKCVKPSDCLSSVCEGGECQPPSCDDRVKNGNESDVDCGGSCDPCGVGQSCVVAADCESPPAEDPAVAQCVQGTCSLLCSGGTDDCNDNAADGCEVNTQVDVDHCGACGNRCRPDNATGVCVAGTCLIEACAPGFADINGDIKDGCEINTNTDPNHCGPERIKCSDHNGTPRCDNGECAIECDPGFDDCNDDLADGCETNLMVNVLHCNGCGNECEVDDPSTQTAYCVDGTCGFTECPEGLGDCDGDQECTDDLNSVANCGRCGNPCTVPDGTPACQSGDCVIESCNPGFDDCKEEEAGCETNINTNPSHCGGCDQACGTTHVQAVNCSMGTCAPTCETGWCPDANPANGCTNPLGTPSHCRSCQEQCSGGTPFCTTLGCHSMMVNDKTVATSDSQNLSFEHTLQTSAAADPTRAVVLLLSDKANPNGLPPTATYDGVPMTRVVERFENQAWAGIYYLLSDDLPGPGTHIINVPDTSGNSQRWAARIVEVVNVDQTDPVVDSKSAGQGGMTCTTALANLNLTTVNGAWVASVLTEARTGTTTPTGQNLTPWTALTTPESIMSHGQAIATGTSRNVSWVNCSAAAWVHVAAAFRPAE